MQFSAQQIADLINARIEGDPQTTVNDFSKIEEGRPGTISFLANPKYEPHIYSSLSSIIIVNESLQLRRPVIATLLRVTDAYQAFATLMQIYDTLQSEANVKKGIEQPSFLHESATIGKDVYIGAFAYIGAGAVIGNQVKIFPGAFLGDKVQVGDNSVIHAGAKVYHHCTLGKGVILHAGCVIGADGFGFAPKADGSYNKVPQLGNVQIGDDVEIGAGTTIDRATLGSTTIHSGVKLDNLIQIAHNVEIGSGTVIAAQTGISGSTKIGKHCMIGGQVGIVGHIQIADGTRINAQSGVSKSITEPNQVITGSPAFEYRNALKSQAVFRHLPELQQDLTNIKQKLNISSTQSGKE